MWSSIWTLRFDHGHQHHLHCHHYRPCDGPYSHNFQKLTKSDAVKWCKILRKIKFAIAGTFVFRWHCWRIFCVLNCNATSLVMNLINTCIHHVMHLIHLIEQRHQYLSSMNNKEPFKILEIVNDVHHELWNSSVDVPNSMDMTKSGWIWKNLASQIVPLAFKTLISHWYSVEIIHSFATSVSS